MNRSPQDDYLTTNVSTAAPQQLQLMLIEGALRLALTAREHWRGDRHEAAGEALIRCQQILTEMMCSLNPAGDSTLVRKVGAIYLFIFRSLVTAHLERSEPKLNEAISVLEVERETWKQLCQKLGTSTTAAGLGADASARTSFVA